MEVGYMAKQGTITLYEGVGKTSKKPFTALMLTVGTWSKLYFVDSQFEMDYIKNQLKEVETKPTTDPDDDDSFLNS